MFGPLPALLLELHLVKFFYMKYLKYRMYSALIIGQLMILSGAYLFVTQEVKTIASNLILAGLVSEGIFVILYLVYVKKRGPRIAK